MALRCPECEWNGGGRYSQEVVDRLDEALERGTESVLDDLTVLIRANMEDQIERFAIRPRGGPDPPRRLLDVPQEYRSTMPSATSSRSWRRSGSSAERSSARLACSTRRRAPARTSSRTPGGGDPVADRLGARGVERSQVQPGQRLVALASEDQRQGDGAVQQVGPAGLSGSLRRP